MPELKILFPAAGSQMKLPTTNAPATILLCLYLTALSCKFTLFSCSIILSSRQSTLIIDVVSALISTFRLPAVQTFYRPVLFLELHTVSLTAPRTQLLSTRQPGKAYFGHYFLNASAIFLMLVLRVWMY